MFNEGIDEPVAIRLEIKWMKTNNKLNPHLELPSGFKPRPEWWETNAVTTVPSLLS